MASGPPILASRWRAPIDAAHGVNPREPQTTLEVPDPTIVNAVLDLWQEVKRNARVVLAVDVSGSMNEENKIAAARDGAAAFVSALGDRDEVALLTFNSQVAWPMPQTPVGPARQRLLGLIGGLFADGGTALYDAVDRALRVARPEPRTVPDLGDRRAVRRRRSQQHSDARGAVEADPVRQRRAARCACSRSATARMRAREELQAIADATQGRYYEGKPENIREVFKEISTFF